MRSQATAWLAVASFLGLTITITEHSRALADHVVLRLTLLDAPGDVETSLLLSGPTDTTDDQPGIEVVLYAGTPGAFIDLSADLAFLTGREFDSADLDQHQGLAGEPDITGLIHAESVTS
ncbi:hypothetical protein V3G39_13710 [Dermatophilaceae bacterium Sec6.4]